jgi:A/G-specific adenine glycosylase
LFAAAAFAMVPPVSSASLSSPKPSPLSAPPVAALLHWYGRHRRRLPWRAEPGETIDPYRVWLSEVMLQQTTVTAVIPYYDRFLRLFPAIENLAAAADDTVMAAWAGLGYYARARNLLACARRVTAMGGFPRDLAGLRLLPGIGDYTAAAVGAIAFGLPTIPVDGNVERVVSRLFAIETPLPAGRPALRLAALRLAADPAAVASPSDTAQALFDLGATVCTPTRPACGVCPWAAECEGRRLGIAETLPRKVPKVPRPVRHGAVFHLTDGEGRLLLQRRPPRGLLGGMTELPGTPWLAEQWTQAEALEFAPAVAAWRRGGEVRHVFTHFELRLEVYAARVDKISATSGFLCAAEDLTAQALPSLMVKCLSLAPKTAVPDSTPEPIKPAVILLV